MIHGTSRHQQRQRVLFRPLPGERADERHQEGARTLDRGGQGAAGSGSGRRGVHAGCGVPG
ncbi:MAG: hypothetical protein ACK55Z_14925, partial [bacterium]